MHGNDKESQLIWEAYVSEEVKLRGKAIDPSEMNPTSGDEEWLTKGTRDGGAPGDDAVESEPADIPANGLKPSQREIYLGKSLGMAMGPMGKGGDIGTIISKDNYILDGHHRWSATMLANPEAEITGEQVQLNIDELITVLRATGVAYGNPFRTKDNEKDINIYDAQTIEDLQAQVDMIEQNGVKDPDNPGKFFSPPGAMGPWLAEVGGIDVLFQRMRAVQAKPPPKGALPREQMPVIKPDKGQVDDSSNRLNRGEIDVYHPYADE